MPMVVLKVKVKCVHCNAEVEKLDARKVTPSLSEQRYECFSCFKRNKPLVWGFGDRVQQKHEYYCERCKYKFSSKSALCPYCSKGDRLTSGKISAKDLL